jgi:organic radical activating enzyme
MATHNQISLLNLDKKYLLEESDVFCMLPWMHLHITPTGRAGPCCIAECCNTQESMGNSRNQSLEELVNSEGMRQLRLDMLHGRKNSNCIKCYAHEKENISTFRMTSKQRWGHLFDEVISNTNFIDGSVNNFKMRYFDIRFSNICNFKCRTCGSQFSSQWELEDLKNGVNSDRVPKNNNPKFLEDVMAHIDHIETAYFAGGEPLITEEHYIVLEELIRKGKTDIQLVYNTNMSNLNYKNKDILNLWKHFSNKIDIWASIDHYGERAEYIRHGTDWDTVEKNYLMAKNTPYLNIQANTVLSVFNCLTIYEFYKYMIDHNMMTPTDSIHTLYHMSDPAYFSIHILPEDLKQQGKESLQKTLELLKKHNFNIDQITQFETAQRWLYSEHTWEEQKHKFREEITRVDTIRGESFVNTFPELSDLYTTDKVKLL